MLVLVAVSRRCKKPTTTMSVTTTLFSPSQRRQCATLPLPYHPAHCLANKNGVCGPTAEARFPKLTAFL